ncbi:MAG: signal peptide peptidase SppA [Verrucomicrobia bacterium]|nr:MAG: signal peptide peptidase SppA [Verrucomicrobiota bacterium]
MVFALILLALLVVSAFFNMGHFVNSLTHGKALHARTGGPKLEEVMTEDNDAANKIAVVEIEGIISSRVIDQGGYTMVDLIKAQLKRAEEDSRVKAVILKVNSPGGEVLASDDINQAIGEFQTKAQKPVIASMGSLAASGGYYVSAPCRWIVANDLTITGSIGVILHTWNYRDLMNKVGLRPDTYKSGKFKDMLSGERTQEEIPPEERAMVQSLIDETYSRFTNVVASGRQQAHDSNKNAKGSKDQGRPLTTGWADYADGRVLSGTEAHRLGFVDELGNFEAAVKRAKTLAKISEANLIEYQQRFDLSDVLRLFGQSEKPVLKVDLGVEAPKLQAGQLYFLSPTFAH